MTATSTLKPYQLGQITTPQSVRKRVIEILSYPTPETIMVRMVPGDATTLVEVATSSVLPYQRKRWCHIGHVLADGGLGLMFPEDMLRYDHAALCDWTQPEEGYYPRADAVLIYTVRDLKKSPWTDGRWLSFSYSVEPVHVWDLKQSSTK
jgi:hypothetical protein